MRIKCGEVNDMEMPRAVREFLFFLTSIYSPMVTVQ
ncbi:hypothetical protein RRG08_067224 [Elysia crispata]|uniref:Uncharacterized protein n=1 Tax=Elysia crispata TaxID=231223 RepID=A0AAE1DV25_9GAST|nr:hypothetical protein RRG08_067224 [Elysia crispata]